MEVVKRWWWAYVLSLGALLEEAADRLVLAWAVLRGKSPKPVDRRRWNRGAEVPTLIDVHDWITERLLFSILVWPPLESAPTPPSATIASALRRSLMPSPRAPQRRCGAPLG